MMRKFLSLLLAAVLLCAVTGALAVGSKTTNDLARVYQTIEESDVPLGATISVSPELTDAARKELAAITAFVAGNKPAADYFGETVKAGMAGFLPAGVSTSDLVLSEFASLTIQNYDAASGDIVSTIGFATPFTADQPVVVVFGYTDESGATVWQALEATVVDGKIKVTFPAELLLKAGNSATIAILSK